MEKDLSPFKRAVLQLAPSSDFEAAVRETYAAVKHVVANIFGELDVY